MAVRFRTDNHIERLGAEALADLLKFNRSLRELFLGCVLVPLVFLSAFF